MVFDNIENVWDDNPAGTPGNETSAHLVASDPAKRIGTAIMLRTMPGDEFRISADCFYQGAYTPGSTVSAADMVSSLTNALLGGETYTGVPVSEMQQNVAIISQAMNNPALPSQLNSMLSANTDPSAPQAYLNYLMFDQNLQLIPAQSGTVQVPTGGGSGIPWTTIRPSTLDGEVLRADAPGYIVIYINNNSIGKDVYFDDIKIEHYNGNVLEESHYYPFGLTVSQTAPEVTAPSNPYKYNTKELETTFGLQNYEYGARQYNSQIGRWNSIDPLADKYYGISPFAYVANNPVKYIDPDGRKIVIAGSQASLATSELQSSTGGNLTFYTNKDGSLGANINFNSLTPMSESNVRLYQAIQDENIIVNINATDSKNTSDGNLYIGGAFMGNKVDQGFFPGNFDNTVETQQDINPAVLKTMDDYYKKPGVTTKHEVLESYEEGVASKESGISAGNGKVDPVSYNRAHEKAPPQSGNVYQDVLDKNGDVVKPNANGNYEGTGAESLRYEVRDNIQPAKTIMTYP